MTLPPKVFTIPAGLGFADSLARYLLTQCGHDPLVLSQALILLPNRRAVRALREAFLRQTNGRPLLLPRLKTVEPDQDDEFDLILDDGLPDLPPAVGRLERTLILARLVLSLGARRGGISPSPDQAVALAQDLGHLLDSMQIERLEADGLNRLVPAELADHWQVTLDFLKLVTQSWPAILAERGLMDGEVRTNQILDALTRSLQNHPPQGLVVAAGSTGSRPATAHLLEAVSRLPQGMVILPGLDQGLDDAAWGQLEESHPQWGMKRLLERLGIGRCDVRPLLPDADPRAARARLLSESLRPAASCEAWRHLGEFPAATLDGVARLDAPSLSEEAQAIALVLRQALEIPGKTAALVTPDRTLAKRVMAELRRWDIEIDDSAGQPLDASSAAVFLRLILDLADQDCAPFPLLAALKHPLAACGHDPAFFHDQVRRLECRALRGPRPAPGLAGLKATCKTDEELTRWLDQLGHALAPILDAFAQDHAPLDHLIRAAIETMENLAASDSQTGAVRLWVGEEGEALARFLSQCLDAARAVGALFPALPPRHFPNLLGLLMAGETVRRPWGLHPRLYLWGPIEARLQQADLMILGGLNEGTWPNLQAADPWMSRPMRHSFGLPLPERRIGLSAHDFAQAFSAPQVILSRSARVDGSPTVPSRWLMRLDTVMTAAGLTFGEDARPWLAWQMALDRTNPVPRQPPPAPCPPVAMRPRSLSVTEIETWMRDPYAIYARHILKLKALDPIDQDPGAAQYGTLVHDAMDRFLSEAGPISLDRLLSIGHDVFAAYADRPGLMAFWWPRFKSAAAWIVDMEQARRPLIRQTLTEQDGRLSFAAPYGPFTLRARADRLDQLKDGRIAILDYKTGAPPTQREVMAGYAPQLPLEGAIAKAGGFPGLSGQDLADLLFWRLKGGTDGGEERSAGQNPNQLADQALDGLKALVAVFDDPATPYAARPHPDFAPKYSDFQHLARLREWASEDEGE